MKTRFMIFGSLVLSVVLLLSVVLPASAQATRKEVSALEASCEAAPPEKTWMEGQVMHIRNYIHHNPLVSDDPELNGINYNVADAQINLLNGNSLVKGTFSIHPDSINGTWEGTWLSIGTKGSERAWAIGQGTGALSGKTIYLDITGTSNDDNLCGEIGPWQGNYLDVGYILESGKP